MAVTTVVMIRLHLHMEAPLELPVVDGETKAKALHPTLDTLVVKAQLVATVLNKVEVVPLLLHIRQVKLKEYFANYFPLFINKPIIFSGSSSAGYSAYGDQAYGGGGGSGYDNSGSYGGSASYGGMSKPLHC